VVIKGLNVSWFLLNTMYRCSHCGCSNTTNIFNVGVLHSWCLAAPCNCVWQKYRALSALHSHSTYSVHFVQWN